MVQPWGKGSAGGLDALPHLDLGAQKKLRNK